MERDQLFISHATPQDNEFSIWLASRLEMLGYKVWIDKDGLLGGERFWPTIQKAIDTSVKILFVYSENIITSEGVLKPGIENEIEYGKSVAMENKLSDFIIPLHIDDSKYHLAIGMPNLNQIPFNRNWADGLKQLKKKLEKDNVPQVFDITQSVMSEWYENEYISNCKIEEKKELYYTSWWSIDEMPNEFYMYHFVNKDQATAVKKSNLSTPVSQMANVLSCFESDLNFNVILDSEEFEIKPVKTSIFSIDEILFGFESDAFPQHRDVENHFKRYLSLLGRNIFRSKGLKSYEMSNKRFAYYLPIYEKIQKIKFIYPYSTKSKLKTIQGKFEEIGKWHYAVSVQPIIFPFVGFSLKSHLLFSSDGLNIIPDEKKQHSYRRKKGKRFFNEEWRDLYLAFIARLIDHDNEIKITVDCSSSKSLKMKNWPETFWSEVGYSDPKPLMDIYKVENYREELNEDNEENLTEND